MGEKSYPSSKPAATKRPRLYQRAKAFDHTVAFTGLTPDVLWEMPLAFDPTPYLKEGQASEIAVRVNNTLGMGRHLQTRILGLDGP